MEWRKQPLRIDSAVKWVSKIWWLISRLWSHGYNWRRNCEVSVSIMHILIVMLTPCIQVSERCLKYILQCIIDHGSFFHLNRYNNITSRFITFVLLKSNQVLQVILIRWKLEERGWLWWFSERFKLIYIPKISRFKPMWRIWSKPIFLN